MPNDGLPFPCFAVPDDPRDPRRVVLVPLSVLHLLRVGSFPKVGQSVVAWVSVDVADAGGWPAGVHVEPREPSRRIFSAVYYDGPSTVEALGEARAFTGSLAT